MRQHGTIMFRKNIEDQMISPLALKSIFSSICTKLEDINNLENLIKIQSDKNKGNK